MIASLKYYPESSLPQTAVDEKIGELLHGFRVADCEIRSSQIIGKRVARTIYGNLSEVALLDFDNKS